MKTKFLLAALSLPMVFAACSDEFDALDSNVANNEGGIKVELNLTNDLKAEGRATWDDEKYQLGWEASDMISMYYTGSNLTGALIGNTNAIFKTTDGSAFTSESLVFEGHNAVVYPANDKHFSTKAVEISVEQKQTATTVTKTPFISNLLSVQNNSNFTNNTPGYHQPVFAPMKMAANVVTLKLDVKNTAALEKYGFDIESVDLVAKDAFAKKSNLVVSDLGTDKDGKAIGLEQKGIQEYKVDGKTVTKETIVKSLWTSPKDTVDYLNSTAVVNNNDGTYDVTFVVLPTDAEAVADAKIVVHTTCGTITLDNGALTEKKDTLHWITRDADKPEATDTLTIAEGLAYFASSITMPADTKASSFDNEKVGRPIPRRIVVDASLTKLDGSKVEDSDDIIRYVNLYKDMKKKDSMNLVMTGTKNAAWKNLTKEAVAAIDAVNAVKETKDKITLTSELVNAIELSTAGAVYDVKAYKGTDTGAKLPVVLTSGAWSMIDSLEVNTNFTKIINKGTLTITGTKKGIVESLENAGTIALSGSKVVVNTTDFTNAAAGIINVAAGQDLNFGVDNKKMYGTINVAKDAMLTIKDAKSLENEGVINNEGIVASEGKKNGIYNVACTHKNEDDKLIHTNGVINIKNADAITYVQGNSATINMFCRENELVVENNTGKLVYNWDYKEDGKVVEKLDTDRFSYLVFDASATNLTLDDTLTEISLEINGSTTMISDEITIADLIVNEKANLKINSGNTLFVTNLVNKGTITIGGIIDYSGNWNDKVGRVLSVGQGAIY